MEVVEVYLLLVIRGGGNSTVITHHRLTISGLLLMRCMPATKADEATMGFLSTIACFIYLYHIHPDMAMM